MPPDATEPPLPAAAIPADAMAMGKLDADRICQRCLHQLHGATVYRDERLQILYTRCTECGTTAAVTEYPQSWKWLRRFSFVVAGVLTVVAFLILVGDVIANSVGSMEAAWETTAAHADALEEIGRQRDPNANWQMSDALRADTEAVAAAFANPLTLQRAAWNMAFMLIPLTIIGLICGVIWSCVLLHRRVWWAVLFQLIPLGLTLLFVAITMKSQGPWGSRSWTYRDFALVEQGWNWAWLAIGWLAVVRVAATLLARPIIHLFLWLVVPKRVRLAMRSVWSEESLPG
jgi:hypothetical protein